MAFINAEFDFIKSSHTRFEVVNIGDKFKSFRHLRGTGHKILNRPWEVDGPPSEASQPYIQTVEKGVNRKTEKEH